MAPVPLVSSRLAFTRDGRTLVAIAREAVVLTETSGAATRQIAIAHPIAAVGFADQIWVAHGTVPMLSRFAITGKPIGAPLALAAGDGTLVAAPVAANAAAWIAATTTTMLVDEAEGLRAIEGPAGRDLALPLTSRRWVTALGGRVIAPSGLACELPSGSRVVGGAIVLDGTATVVLSERAAGRELSVIALASGRPQLHVTFPAALVRVATRRGLVASIVEPGRVHVLDLRSGRSLGDCAIHGDAIDLAFHPDGRVLAVRRDDGSVELVDLSAALAATPVAPVVEPTIEATPVLEPILVEEPAVAPRPRELCRPFDLHALAPVTTVVPVEREAALALLDHETRSVALWTLRAIADAWDSRRIGYGNEGQHPYEHEVAALLGANSGFAPEHVAAAHDHVVAHEAIMIPDRRSPATPLGMLAGELGLSALAVDILLVVAAPALWSEAARLYGILANDPARALVDEALVEQILGPRANRHDIAAALDPRGPLVQLGVIVVDRVARPFARLDVDPIVLARLRREAPGLGPAVSARGSDRALEELVLAAAVIPDALAALARTPGHARIALRGRPGSGRRTLMAALAAEAGRALGTIESTLLPRSAFAPALRAALQRAQLAGLLPCVVGLEDTGFREPSDREAVSEVLRAHPGPLAIVLPANESAPLAPGHVAIDLPVLPEGDRLGVWRAALADAGLVAGDPSVLAARYRIGPGAIHRAIGAVVARPGTGDGDATAELEAYIRQTRDSRLGAHARRVERLASWDTLVLPADVLDSLHELVARVRHRRTVFETWGMEQTMATSRGLTALFSGPPGTGKTLVAGVIARELGLDLYQVDLSKLMSKWLGETERNLASIFDAAEDGQVILLFDEADSLFAKRTEVRSSNDRYANLEVNYLLQRLDTFEGIAILTTNASGSIDPAFKRRLSFRLSFPFPDEDTRQQLWRAHLPSSLPQIGLAFEKLAHKYQLSGGYIRNACLRAAFLAAEDAQPVSQSHLERAVALEFAELGKLSTSGSID